MGRHGVRLITDLIVAGTLAATLGVVPTAGAAPEGRDGVLDRYLVMLRGGPSSGIEDVLGDAGVDSVDDVVRHRYRAALSGFAASLTLTQATMLRADPRVLLVEADRPVTAFAEQITPLGVDRVADPTVLGQTIPALSINGQDDVRVDTDIAILDTGIASHPDLNVVGGTNCLSAAGERSACVDGPVSDVNGHGTHVAGTAAAIDDPDGVVGVAPGARLWSVTVLDGRGGGFPSDVVAGIDWVTARADVIDVANMSLGGFVPRSAVLDAAIAASVDRGIVYVVAAGNAGTDVSGTFPANHPDVITVSAMADFDGVAGGAGEPCSIGITGVDDTLAGFSNNGNRIDVAAPGTCVISTVPGGFAVTHGTSMAAAYVTGAVALLAAKAKPTDRAGVLGIRGVIEATGNLGWVDDSGDGFHEPLLDVSSRSYRVGSGPSVSSDCPATTAVPAGFADVATTNAHHRSVDCVITLGVARGTSATTYAPGERVTRAQMASFVAQAIEASGTTLVETRDHFSDDDGSIHQQSINKLAEAGVVRGVSQGGFAPEQPISRAQMATFLVKAHDVTTGRALRRTSNAFVDDDGDVHEANIDAAAQAGFALGVGDKVFEPRLDVRRDQMASFLVRLFRRLAAAGEPG